MTFLFFLLAFGYLCLFLVWFVLVRKNKWLDVTNIPLIVLLGLVYDNLIIASGSIIGEGLLLKNLSIGRHWLHAFLTPTLILFAWGICFKTGFRWAQKTIWKVLAPLLTIGLILFELIIVVMKIKMEPRWENGLLTYENIAHTSSPFMVVVVTTVLLVVGFLLIRKFHFPWLFIGTFAMIIGGVVGIWIKNPLLMNVFELLFLISIFLTKLYQIRTE